MLIWGEIIDGLLIMSCHFVKEPNPGDESGQSM